MHKLKSRKNLSRSLDHHLFFQHADVLSVDSACTIILMRPMLRTKMQFLFVLVVKHKLLRKKQKIADEITK